MLNTGNSRFLDKACIKVQNGDHKKESPWRLCSENQVKQVRLILCMIPIFACIKLFVNKVQGMWISPRNLYVL
ncbi:hypothetical protein Syun_002221 [Stephania yunnanensis]|uniref:Uncharacterized protein n=1 Tax=Stephania yunnanensis TaxID=152371 RepID=A0AAP0QBM4_9MAGN